MATSGTGLAAAAIGLREVLFQSVTSMAPAGSIYTYPAEAIHPALGFLVGWGYALVEALLGPITMVLSGYLFGSIAHSEWGWPFTATWVIFMIVGAILVAALTYRGIQVSARAGTLLGLFEITVCTAIVCQFRTRVPVREFRRRGASRTQV